MVKRPRRPATADNRASLDSGVLGGLVEHLHTGGLGDNHREDEDNVVIAAGKLILLLLKWKRLGGGHI